MAKVELDTWVLGKKEFKVKTQTRESLFSNYSKRLMKRKFQEGSLKGCLRVWARAPLNPLEGVNCFLLQADLFKLVLVSPVLVWKSDGFLFFVVVSPPPLPPEPTCSSLRGKVYHKTSYMPGENRSGEGSDLYDQSQYRRVKGALGARS